MGKTNTLFASDMKKGGYGQIQSAISLASMQYPLLEFPIHTVGSVRHPFGEGSFLAPISELLLLLNRHSTVHRSISAHSDLQEYR